MDHHDRSSSAPPAPTEALRDRGVSRRSFMQTLGVSAAASAVQARAAEGAANGQDAERDGLDQVGPGPVPVTLRVNNRDVRLTLDPATTLMEALRWDMRLTGTKEVCDRGSCGACSVLVDGRLVTSCMMLALDARGKQVTTIEGLAEGDDLDPVQEAFIRHDALQCGFCTPGLVMAARALLDENPRPTLDEVKAGLSGNICRCGTYTNVFNAVLDASGQAPVVDMMTPVSAPHGVGVRP